MKEERLERDDFLSMISELFATKPGKKFGGGDGEELDGGAAAKPKKGVELKVLDANSAKNIGRSYRFIIYLLSNIHLIPDVLKF